jgi:hypothetical protein
MLGQGLVLEQDQRQICRSLQQLLMSQTLIEHLLQQNCTLYRKEREQTLHPFRQCLLLRLELLVLLELPARLYLPLRLVPLELLERQVNLVHQFPPLLQEPQKILASLFRQELLVHQCLLLRQELLVLQHRPLDLLILADLFHQGFPVLQRLLFRLGFPGYRHRPFDPEFLAALFHLEILVSHHFLVDQEVPWRHHRLLDLVVLAVLAAQGVLVALLDLQGLLFHLAVLAPQ